MSMLARRTFKLSHSVFGLCALVVIQGFIVTMLPVGAVAWFSLLIAAVGGVGTVYVATEVIEEVRNAQHMLVLLSAIVIEFILFFAAQYYFFARLSPVSFPSMPHDAVSAVLQSVMVFVFNPLYLPEAALGRALLLIHTLCALGLVLFILQNISQFRRDLR